jgi:hypothetical protein
MPSLQLIWQNSYKLGTKEGNAIERIDELSHVVKSMVIP